MVVNEEWGKVTEKEEEKDRRKKMGKKMKHPEKKNANKTEIMKGKKYRRR